MYEENMEVLGGLDILAC